ncbi:MAG: hypothetical protein ACRC8Y_23845 [Chroococcales cyanobacterium]
MFVVTTSVVIRIVRSNDFSRFLPTCAQCHPKFMKKYEKILT